MRSQKTQFFSHLNFFYGGRSGGIFLCNTPQSLIFIRCDKFRVSFFSYPSLIDFFTTKTINLLGLHSKLKILILKSLGRILTNTLHWWKSINTNMFTGLDTTKDRSILYNLWRICTLPGFI